MYFVSRSLSDTNHFHSNLYGKKDYNLLSVNRITI
jgi:hypothetical protein